jgi:hypothetical protein
MNTNTEPPPEAPQTTRRSDADAWARPVDRLNLEPRTDGALTSTVHGKRLAGPMQGFGRMWQKTFRVRLTGVGDEITPQTVIAAWKEHFPEFWPKGNTFYAPLAGIRPGEVALLSVKAGGPVKLHTGVMVTYADDESFTLMTPEGHMLAAWITFSARRDPDGTVVAQAQALERERPALRARLSAAHHPAHERSLLGADARVGGAPPWCRGSLRDNGRLRRPSAPVALRRQCSKQRRLPFGAPHRRGAATLDAPPLLTKNNVDRRSRCFEPSHQSPRPSRSRLAWPA